MRRKTNVTRRDFFATLAKSREITGEMTYREGRRGEKVSLLGYGAMRLPTKDGQAAMNRGSGASGATIDQEAVNEQVDFALAHGVNYFDTSPAYCRGESERVMGTALARHPREKYFIATKMSNFSEQTWPLEKSQELFAASLKALRTDYIDFYLLHAVGIGGFGNFTARYVQNGLADWLAGRREAGAVRNLGFSFHGDRRAFDWCIEHHDKYKWDFCQIQMNYVDWRHAQEVNTRNLDAKYLYETLTEKGIPVVVMEPLLGGRLARFNYAVAAKLKGMDPEASLASWALRFCGTFPNVLTILSGMTYMENVQENIATLSPLKPLAPAQLDALEEAALLVLKNKTLPCNLCQYCMPCPYGIDIPGNFDCWNRACTEDRLPDPAAADYARDRKSFLAALDAAVPHLRQPGHCIGCGRCNPHCPQRIDIPAQMEMLDNFISGLRKEERSNG